MRKLLNPQYFRIIAEILIQNNPKLVLDIRKID